MDLLGDVRAPFSEDSSCCSGLRPQGLNCAIAGGSLNAAQCRWGLGGGSELEANISRLISQGPRA
eukprot:6410881-Pyramimonas_sp.AAC.2